MINYTSRLQQTPTTGEDPQPKNDPFLAQLSQIKANISSFKQLFDSLDKMQNKTLQLTDQAQIASSNALCERYRSELNDKSAEIKAAIQRLKECIAKDGDRAQAKQRQAQYRDVSVKFCDLLKEYQENEINYSRDKKLQIKRQYQTIRPNATEHELSLLTEAEEGPMLLQQATQLVSGKQAEQVINRLEEQQQDLFKIEQQIDTIASLFQEMAAVIEQQGEGIEQLAVNIDKVETDVEKANVELGEAVKYQKAARRKKLTFIFIVTMVVIIIVVVVLIVVLGGR